MINVGDAAPDFSLMGTDGKMHSISDYRGKPVVLFFFPKCFTGTCERQISGNLNSPPSAHSNCNGITFTLDTAPARLQRRRCGIVVHGGTNEWTNPNPGRYPRTGRCNPCVRERSTR
ncbi:MAG: hypothetical protein EBU62_00615 [Proteobacteria bacterium]|nr:hypothetical protein [Pseudomonadota bacterium]